MTRCQTTLALWVLPVTFTGLLLAMLLASLPLWQVFNLDPDYYYLLNGLRMVEGLAPTDLSHPGTPVQVIIAAVLRLMHPFADADAIVDAVLHDPEGHLLAATLALYPLVTAGLYLLGRAFLNCTGSLWPALLAQSSPFLSMIIPKFALHPKPEPLLVVAGALMAAAAIAAARSHPPRDRHAVALGIALGFGVALKMQFVALGLVPLLLLNRRQLLLVYPAAALASFLLFVAPALPSYPFFMEWWGRILTHSGAYGSGAAGVADAGIYPRAILKIFGSKLVFSATLATALAVLAGYWRLRRRGLWPADPLARLLAGLVLAQLATVALVAKQSAAHYLIPALMLTGPTLALLWMMTRPRSGAGKIHRRAWTAVSVLLVVLSIPAAWRQSAELAGWSRTRQNFDMGRFQACAKIFFDSASALSYALQRGDMNAQVRYSARLAGWMPADEYTWFTNDHFWWPNSLMQWNKKIALDTILARHPCVVFRGSQPWTLPPRLEAEHPGLAFDDQCQVGEETLYTRGVRCDGRPVQAP